MEIEVGEWVRTNKGLISKVVEIRLAKHIERDIVQDVYILKKGEWTAKQYIVSHSKNKIDLIQEGDYVNGHLVTATYLLGVRKYIKLDNAYENGKGIRTYEKDIKSVVTKEQFSSVEYILEEE